MVALYGATGGPQWVDSENRLSDAPLGDWEGVRTDSNGRVIELYPYGNQFSWGIPPELGNLANLTSLALDGNQLSWKIPPELGNLVYLEELDLGDNQLHGCVRSSLSRQLNFEYPELADLTFCP